MDHLEEGTIHAWLDGALGDDEGREIERHLAGCPACAAAVAEARGLVARASHVLTMLDDVPSGVVPEERPAPGQDQLAELRLRHRAGVTRRRSWWRSPNVLAAAAIGFIAVGTTVVVKNSTWASRRSAMETAAPVPQAVADAVTPSSRDSIVLAAPAQPAPGGATAQASRQFESRAAAGKEEPLARGVVAVPSPAPTPAPPARAGSSVGAAERKAAVTALIGRVDSTGRQRMANEDSREVAPVTAAGAAAKAAGDARRKVVDRLEASELRAAAPADARPEAAATALPLAGCYAIRVVAVGGGPVAIAAVRLPAHVALDSTRVRDVAEVVFDARDVSPEDERAPGSYRWRPTGPTTFELIVVRDGSTIRFAAASGDRALAERLPATPAPAGAPVRLAATREACR